MSQQIQDPLEKWQYRIFRWLLFILFLATVYKVLDYELHLKQFLSQVGAYISAKF